MMSIDEGVGLEERILQFLEDWHLLDLHHFVLLQVIYVYSMRDVSKDIGQACLVHEDLQVRARITEMPHRLELQFHRLFIFDALIEVNVESEYFLDITVRASPEKEDGVAVIDRSH